MNAHDIYFTTYEAPKTYSYIPESYKLVWPEHDKFLPSVMEKSFNQKMHYNFLHRECFNSCVTDSSSLSKTELNCYKNCQSKHSYSMGTFKSILLAKRKWKGFLNFVNVKEYSRRPEEMTTGIPTDPMMNLAYYKAVEELKDINLKSGIIDLFGGSNVETKNIFDMYLEGRLAQNSQAEKEHLKEKRKDIYNEYQELNDKYGDKIQELLKKRVNLKNWRGIPGDDWEPEEEETTTEAAAEEAPTESEES